MRNTNIVLRGGSSNYSGGDLTATIRYGFPPEYRYDNLGFRPVSSRRHPAVKMLHGGSCHSSTDNQRAAARVGFTPDHRVVNLGFRLVTSAGKITPKE